MFKVLIVEDDNFKSENLHQIVSTNIDLVEIDCAADVATAVSKVEKSIYDLIIIDMALPSHPAVSGGGAPMQLLNGGLEIILELSALERRDRCVIVTQYPDIPITGKHFPVSSAGQAIKEHFSCEVVACFQYSDSSDEWKNAFIKTLKNL